MIYLQEQLSLIRYLQELRGPLFDEVLRLFNVLDTFAYYSVLVSFIWVGFSWRWGVRLGFLLVVNGIVNSIAKIAFAMPRPFYYDPSLAVVHVGGYGFPSGGAQTAMLFGVLLIAYWKNRWAWPCAVAYILLISFSRVFLGVHFVLDLLGGWVLGLIVAALFIYAARPIEAFASKKPNGMLALFCFSLLLGAALLPAKLQFLIYIALTCALGIYLSTRYGLYFFSEKRVLWRKCLHGAIAIVGAWVLGYGAEILFSGVSNEYLMRGVVGALWVSLLASPFCKRI